MVVGDVIWAWGVQELGAGRVWRVRGGQCACQFATCMRLPCKHMLAAYAAACSGSGRPPPCDVARAVGPFWAVDPADGAGRARHGESGWLAAAGEGRRVTRSERAALLRAALRPAMARAAETSDGAAALIRAVAAVDPLADADAAAAAAARGGGGLACAGVVPGDDGVRAAAESDDAAERLSGVKRQRRPSAGDAVGSAAGGGSDAQRGPGEMAGGG